MTGTKFVFAILCAAALGFGHSQAAVLDFKEILDAGTPKIQVFLDNVLQNTFTGEKVEGFKFTSTVRETLKNSVLPILEHGKSMA